jgi:hypothetical protein
MRMQYNTNAYKIIFIWIRFLQKVESERNGKYYAGLYDVNKVNECNGKSDSPYACLSARYISETSQWIFMKFGVDIIKSCYKD